MLRPRTIVGLGEALILESPRERRPSGMALRVAMEATRLGQLGVPVSRLGQDSDGAELVELLRAAGVSTEHLQSDPDLPTGRATVLPRGRRLLNPAYLNLQWDHDLLDLAQGTDAVIFGSGACESAQSRSVIQQFIAECGAALRLFDLVHRPKRPVDRALLGPLLRAADVALVDAESLSALVPTPGHPSPDEVAATLLRQFELRLVLLASENAGDRELRAWDGERWWPMDGTCSPGALGIAVIASIVALQCGADLPGALSAAGRVARFASAHPAERVPKALLVVAEDA